MRKVEKRPEKRLRIRVSEEVGSWLSRKAKEDGVTESRVLEKTITRAVRNKR